MKYQCVDCHKTFIHPAKKIEPLNREDQSLAVTVPHLSVVNSQLETYVCPFCQSLNLEEFVESKPNVVDVVSVDFTEVPNHYNRGYRVHAIYAKEVIMTLTKKEESS